MKGFVDVADPQDGWQAVSVLCIFPMVAILWLLFWDHMGWAVD